jgi:tetratricopeptide (TPR) repeat protein
MYYFLVDVPVDEDTNDTRIEAMEPELCSLLDFERASLLPGVKLHFRINPSCLHLDYLRVNHVVNGRLCSKRFIDVLTSESVSFIAYPAQLLDVATGQPLDANYWFWLPHSIEGAIDLESSEIWINPRTGKRHLSKLVLATPVEVKGPFLFRPKESARFLIHDRLRVRLQSASIIGTAFAPLDAASLPLLGVQKLDLARRLQDDATDVDSWSELASLQRQLHRQQEALTAIDRALMLNPHLDEAWRLRGLILHDGGFLQEAREAFKQAIQANPQGIAWTDYTAVLRELGFKQEAVESAQHLVQIRSNSPLSWYELGAILAEMEEYEEALQAFEKALVLGRGPRLVETYLGKAEMLFQLEHYEEALKAYTHGLTLRPWKQALWEGKAKVLRVLGQIDEAEGAEEEVRKLEQEREKNLRARPT